VSVSVPVCMSISSFESACELLALQSHVESWLGGRKRKNVRERLWDLEKKGERERPILRKKKREWTTEKEWNRQRGNEREKRRKRERDWEHAMWVSWLDAHNLSLVCLFIRYDRTNQYRFAPRLLCANSPSDLRLLRIPQTSDYGHNMAWPTF